MQVPSPQQDQVTLLSFRVDALERTVSNFNQQLNSYVRERENDLKLKILQDTASHIGDEVSGLKGDMSVVRDEVKALRESQSQLQIRALVAILSTIVLVVTGWLVGVLNHWIP